MRVRWGEGYPHVVGSDGDVETSHIRHDVRELLCEPGPQAAARPA